MDATADELAGVVDMFGGLTREELERALDEAAFRADGQSVDDDAVDPALEDALESFALVEYRPVDDGALDDGALDEGSSGDGDTTTPLLVAGPTAFPTTPRYAEDLPHILDIEPRTIDRAALGAQARDSFERAVDEAVAADDADRAGHLLDVSYDLEAWAPVSVDDARERLDDLLESADGSSSTASDAASGGTPDASPE